MFIGIHMVALSLDCLMLSPSLAAAIDGWSRCSPVGVVLIRAVLSGSRAAVVMTLVAWWLWRPGLSVGCLNSDECGARWSGSIFGAGGSGLVAGPSSDSVSCSGGFDSVVRPFVSRR